LRLENGGLIVPEYETPYSSPGFALFISRAFQDWRRAFGFGVMFFNESAGRLDVAVVGEGSVRGLHAGDCVDVLMGGEWRGTRVEGYGSEWRLVGLDGETRVEGLWVRFTYRQGRLA
jgi:hypothetical protein